jgi:hypothetical protein
MAEFNKLPKVKISRHWELTNFSLKLTKLKIEKSCTQFDLALKDISCTYVAHVHEHELHRYKRYCQMTALEYVYVSVISDF